MDGGVEIATDDDLRVAVASALASIGMTYPELAAEADRRVFSSDQARRVWFAIGGLPDRLTTGVWVG